MFNRYKHLVIAIALSVVGASAATAQSTHEIKMEGGKGEESFRFSPSAVSARAGDVLVFRVVSGGPHSVVFEAKGLSPAAQEALNAAMPGRSGNLSSPLLTDAGETYRVTIPAGLPAGTYRFYCLPHRAYDMRGEVTVR